MSDHYGDPAAQKKRDKKGLDLGQCAPSPGQAKDSFHPKPGNFKNVGSNRGPASNPGKHIKY